MIGILEYGLGNIAAIRSLLLKEQIQSEFVSSASELDSVNRLILPGVGSFDHAMSLLDDQNLIDPLHKLAFKKKIPIIGICVGMQIMALSSDEGDREGLGWFKSRVTKMASSSRTPLPHMGWNTIKKLKDDPIMNGIEDFSELYFLHSFCFADNKHEALAISEYTNEFSSIIKKENLYGIQPHPEKSHEVGKKLLVNFCKM